MGDGTGAGSLDPYCHASINPDVDGLGIRVSIYVQTLSLVVLFFFDPPKDRRFSFPAVSRIQLYTFITLLSALIILHYATKNLTALDAFVILRLMGLLLTSGICGILLSRKTPRDHKVDLCIRKSRSDENLPVAGSSTRMVIAGCVRLVLSLGLIVVLTILSYILWKDHDRLCVDGRNSSSLPIAVTFFAWRMKLWEDNTLLWIHVVSFGVFGFFLLPLFIDFDRGMSSGRWWRRLITLFYLLVWINEVVSIERTLHVSTSPSSTNGFGQIVALLILVPTFEAIITGILERKSARAAAHKNPTHSPSMSEETLQFDSIVPVSLSTSERERLFGPNWGPVA